MKKIFLAFILVVLGVSVGAKLNPMGRLMLRNERQALSRADSDAPVDSTAPYVPLLLLVESDSIYDELLEKQVIIYNQRENIVLASVPRDSVESVTDLVGVVYACASAPMNLCMDEARRVSEVDAVQRGEVGDHGPVKGSGIVVGFSDIGFDAQHIAFQGKIAQIYDYKTLYGVKTSAVTPAEVGAWVTDDPENYHATHVANILAGSYMDCPYYGVAPEAEMVATTSDLYDAGILAGVEDVIAYGKQQGKPTVINLSLGSTYGPHDGTDLFCRYLSSCANDAVICLAAGNDGNYTCYASGTLNRHDENDYVQSAHVAFKDRPSGTALNVKGWTDVWSSDDRSFDLRFELYDTDERKITFASQWMDVCELTDTVNLCEILPEEWQQIFHGTMYAYSELNVLNNRFEMLLSYDLSSDVIADRGPWSKYMPAFALRAKDIGEQRVDFFADASTSTLEMLPMYEQEYTEVGNDGSISNMAFTDGVIVSGMYYSRSGYPVYPDEEREMDFPVYNVVRNTSYAYNSYMPLFPHICAPGMPVISALSTPFYELYRDQVTVSAVSEVDGKSYYWFPAGGTSMASPYTAGVMALWLQVNPRLSPPELLGIAQSTARWHYWDPRWGAGQLDASAGLQKVIASTPFVSEAEPMIEVTPGRRIEVTVPGCADPEGRVKVYNMGGMPVDHTSVLAPGIYIVAIDGYTPRKVLVK